MSEVETMPLHELVSSTAAPPNVNIHENERQEHVQGIGRENDEEELRHAEPQESKPSLNNSPSRQDSINPVKSPSPSSRSPTSSPEPSCPICLGKMENTSFANTCRHQFCFTCLLEWSKVKPQCPLCKQPFKSIIHSIRSKDDFDRYDLTPDQQEPTVSGGRFRYRTTLGGDGSFGRRRLVINISRRMIDGEPTRMRMVEVPPPRFLDHHRRHVYDYNQWVQPVSRNEGVRRSDTAFYANNPAITHRLVPWLNRELIALNCGSRVAFIMDLILSLLQRFHILSPEFADNVRPFVGEYTRHFLHEFYHFARSPHEMRRYDEVAIYPHASNYPFPNNNNDDDDDSDVQVVDVVERNNSGIPPWSHRNPIIFRARDFLNSVDVESSFQNPVPEPVLSPQPGPSGMSNVVQEIEDLSSDVSLSSDDGRPMQLTLKSEVPRPSADDSSEIEILDPPPKKAPEVISLTDEDDNQPRPSTSFVIKSTVNKLLKPKAGKVLDSDDEWSDSSTRSSSSEADTLRKRKLKHLRRRHYKSRHEKKFKKSESEDSDSDSQESGHKKKKAKIGHRYHRKHKSKKSKN